MPEAEQKIENEELTLTAAASVQAFFKTTKNMPSVEKKQVFSSCLNKSSREVEKELASRQPAKDKRDDVRYTNAERLRLSLNISEDLYEKLEKLKYVLRLKKVEDVIHHLADKELKVEKAADSNLPQESLPAPVVQTRYIPKAIKRIVIKRNSENRCVYRDPITHKQCNEKHGLQFDHIKPYSQGGPNIAENLRLLCGQHN